MPSAQIRIEIPEPGFVGKAIQSAQLKLEKSLTEDIRFGEFAASDHQQQPQGTQFI